MDDPSVDRFLVRDADSLLSEREVAAVDEWLASGRRFHHMRDYFTHTELLLPAMWGGCTSVIPSVTTLIESFLSGDQGAARFTDQYFLRAALWPTVRESILNHDETFGFHDAKPFPDHPPIRWRATQFRVGSNAAYQSISGESARPSGSRQQVELAHANEPPVADDAHVHLGKWTLTMPFFLIDEIRSGQARVAVR
ncbi:hypothetical protein [Burkholderia ambifaria]|uniref:Uncharacterized protein n=1 Tax=Burkholderia ambifaria MEX-5 TaxID=396597 RepID=B1T0Q2_9BURK|nr:hypothetical protein [Burkholderia ambifaria]EDT42877.1 hypothetical protein BamMEX5DRAFT_1368 [Burkholderia ambifaria MEX-5]